MRLQIKKLEGPDEIKINNDRTLPSYTAAMADNQTANKFTCYFNQTLSAASFANGDIEVIIKIYDNEGSEHAEQSLTVQNTHVTDNENNYTDHFHFSLTLDSPETFSGSYFHVHAIIVNADTNAQNIGYRISSYHTCIKQVYISDEPEFLEVYWTTAEIPGADPTETVPENRPETVPVAGENETAEERTTRETWERERPQREQNRQTTRQTTRQTQRREKERIGQIYQNEDALLYIRSIGIYNKSVAVVITANNDEVVLVSKYIRMKQNRRVLAYPMDELMQRYLQRTGNEENETFTLKAWVFYRNDSGEITAATATQQRPHERVIQYALAVMPLLPPTLTRRVSRITLQGIEHESPDPAANMIFDSSGNLELVLSDADTPAKATSTGTVYVRATSREISTIAPTKFRDFRVGCIVHIEGVGRTRAELNNAQAGTYHTVYPINVYEIMLSDLVTCGLVTITEAAYLTTTNHDGINLRERTDLENTFDKLTALLSSTKRLIHVFQDRTNTNTSHRDRINKNAARKVLAQVKLKPTLWAATDGQEMCRDGWQLITSGTSGNPPLKTVYSRTQNGRYNSYKECPPGEYFLNYVPPGSNGKPKYRIFVSQEPTGQTIYTYPGKRTGDQNRTAIAIHRGGAKAAIGCITFNVRYSVSGGDSGNYALFNNTIYPDKNNEKRNIHWINLLCMDERNALQSQADSHTVYRGANNTNAVTQNFWRWYDLATPK